MWHSVELGDAETPEERRTILLSTIYMIQQSLRNDVRDLEIIKESMVALNTKSEEKMREVISILERVISLLDEVREELKT